MQEFQFEALGTLFAFLVDTEKLPKSIWDEIQEKTNVFDQKFSRFIEKNPLNEVHFKESGTYPVSKELHHLLSFAEKLKSETDGAFDPAIAGLLDKAGYSNKYTFSPEKDLGEWKTPQWKLTNQSVQVDAPVIFDIGAYGKGYWIDTLSGFLTSHGFPFHLVDGGGDLFGTEKADGQPWTVAIEWPGKPDTAIGEVELKHQGIAVSDVFKRSWQHTARNGEHWHHVIDARKKKPLQHIIGAAILGPSAMIADGLSTGLMLIDDVKREQLAKKNSVEYLIYTDTNTVHMSKNWPGKFYN